MMKNRHQRRAERSQFKKELRTAVFDTWEDKTLDFVLLLKSEGRPTDKILFFKKNSIYTVQAFRYGENIVFGIRRHDQGTNVGWADKQRVKNELFGPNVQAIEFFPPESELVDDANIYWLWIPKDLLTGFHLRDALRSVYS